jgi:hypothetical protein
MSCLTRARKIVRSSPWPISGRVPVVLVGAVAFACRLSVFTRITNDLDVVVYIGLDEYPRLAELAGWTPDREGEHAWRSPDGIEVDVVPSGPSAITNEAESEEVAAFVAAASDTDAVTHARMIHLAPNL